MLQPIDLSPKSHYLKMETKCPNPTENLNILCCAACLGGFWRLRTSRERGLGGKFYQQGLNFNYQFSQKRRTSGILMGTIKALFSLRGQLVQGKCVFIIVHFLLSSLLNVINSSHPMFVILQHRGDSIRVARL